MPFRRAPNCATGPHCAGAVPAGASRSGMCEHGRTHHDNRAGRRAQSRNRACRSSASAAPRGHPRRTFSTPFDSVRGSRPSARCAGHVLRLGARATVRERQPASQLPRRLVGGVAVERHQRRRHAGATHYLRAPPAGANARRFDLIRAPTDDLFRKFLDNHVFATPTAARTRRTSRAVILRGRQNGSSETKRKDAVHSLWRDVSPTISLRGFFSCRVIHRKFTVGPHLFHSPCTAMHAAGRRHSR
jgi:hypothetical protein